MTDMIIYLIIGLILGGILGWFIVKLNTNKIITQLKDESQKNYANLDKEFAEFKATSDSKIHQQVKDLSEKEEKITELQAKLETSEEAVSTLENEKATQVARINSLDDSVREKTETIKELQKMLNDKAEETKTISEKLATKSADLTAANKRINEQDEELSVLKEDLATYQNKFNQTNESLASVKAENKSLQEKLNTQKVEMEEMGKKFNTEFENIASKILKANTESFSDTHKEKLKTLLDPLGKNISEFKQKVEDVYEKEAKQRFSLGEKVADLVKLNEQISQDAINLTNALKGEAKTQGRWGEMILESILEKSGLRKDEEYFIEHQLLDDNGKPLRSDSENKKMRPDAVIKYPDNRNVIIDSKVSLNAFTRYLETNDVEKQKKELDAHVSAIKTHINALSNKGYDDYDKALDFVMMFIPSEPAYIAAMQNDSGLWDFAYNKRILLMNPTNLITSLKLIVDLWKREYQNQNAVAIADRGAKLHDKFVGFVNNLEKVGKYIGDAQTTYDNAYKQLKTGNDNLVLQATKLKDLGVKNKKNLDNSLVNDAELSKLKE